LANTMSQDDLNELMHDLGRANYRKMRAQAQKEGEESRTIVGQQLVRHSIESLHEGIIKWREQLGRYGAKRNIRLVEMFDEFNDVGMIAPFVARTIVDSLYKEQSVQSVSYHVSKRLLEERREQEFRKMMPAEFRHAKHRANSKRRTSAWKRNAISKAARKAEALLTRDWTKGEMMDFGAHMVEICARNTDLVDIALYRPLTGRKPKVRYHRYRMVVPSQVALDWLESGHAELEVRRPVYLPMVEPPWDWTDQYEGGFPDGVFRRWPLVKQRKHHQKHYAPDKIPQIYQSVNYMQKTGWRVNDRVLEVVDHFWKMGGGIAGLPSLDDIPLPQKPVDIKENEVARKAYGRQAAITHQHNNANKNRRLLHAGIISNAKMFQGERFYFPWCVDFRGRAYPVGSSYIHPQGCKLARSLLLFSEGLPIDEKEQVRWFMIHGANCWGLDKQSFEERLHWVQEAHKEIIAVAQNPYEFKLWMDADDPFGFLAWCFEYSDWMEDPTNFVSSIAVGQDHTNSGLQLYSLLLRDRKGAIATNCCPTDSPNDSYQMVADVVTLRLLEISKDHNHRYQLMAEIWLRICNGSIPRSVTKRNVMTIPYGAKPHSQREYIEEWVRDYVAKSSNDKDRWILDNIWDFTIFIVPLITEAVREVCPSPLVAMDFIRELAKLCVKHGHEPTWVTPLGFRVVQECKRQMPAIFELLSLSKPKQVVNYRVLGEGLSPAKAKDGMPPNFVHSLDATLMHRIALKMEGYGVSHISMIHDDYRTHAAHAPLLAQVTREVLVETFTPDLLNDLREQVKALLPEGTKIPELPEYGDLDINEVLDADYILS